MVVVILAPMSSVAAQQQGVTITRVLNVAGPAVSDSSGIACQANISATFGYFYYDFPHVPGAVLLYGPNCTEEGLDQAECTVTGTIVLS